MPRPVTHACQRFLRSRLEKRSHRLSDDELCEPTVVIAPHQDDETLGCGGTIARKRRLGSRVRIIFTTDGSRSHDGLMPRDDMAKLRKEEALTACEALGVHQRDVRFLDIENDELARDEQRNRALSMLMDHLAADPPRQMFIPYHREPPPDHHVTAAIALEAIDRLELVVSVYEYPIWFWHFWPFSCEPAGSPRGLARRLKHTFTRLGPMLRELRTAVAVHTVLDLKREALSRHTSQTARRDSNPNWPILDDVCDGAFTELFFQPHEYFYERVRAPIAERDAAPVNADAASAAEVAL